MLMDFTQTLTGTISFLVLFILVHASCLLVQLVLLKGIPGITEQPHFRSAFRALGFIALSSLSKWDCPVPLFTPGPSSRGAGMRNCMCCLYANKHTKKNFLR